MKNSYRCIKRHVIRVTPCEIPKIFLFHLIFIDTFEHLPKWYTTSIKSSLIRRFKRFDDSRWWLASRKPGFLPSSPTIWPVKKRDIASESREIESSDEVKGGGQLVGANDEAKGGERESAEIIVHQRSARGAPTGISSSSALCCTAIKISAVNYAVPRRLLATGENCQNCTNKMQRAASNGTAAYSHLVLSTFFLFLFLPPVDLDNNARAKIFFLTFFFRNLLVLFSSAALAGLIDQVVSRNFLANCVAWFSTVPSVRGSQWVGICYLFLKLFRWIRCKLLRNEIYEIL